MPEEDDRLTTPSHWERRGDEIASNVDVGSRSGFRRQAALLKHALYGRPYESVVEIGAYPGHVLHWICRTFGLRGTAIEYVPSQARSLARAFSSLEVLDGDFLAPATFAPGRTWDVVFSLGLVEHWSDLRAPLARHVEMTARGGTCIVGIPLHDGVYGRIMRVIDPGLHAQHGCYSIGELRAAFLKAAGPGWTIETCRAIEGMGFWNCGLAEWIDHRGPVMRTMGQKALGAWHRTVTRLPAPAALRPNAILVARRA
jgi:hypothetical protein